VAVSAALDVVLERDQQRTSQ
jgi:hypothetical protein